jgi:hypothetical protein
MDKGGAFRQKAPGLATESSIQCVVPTCVSQVIAGSGQVGTVGATVLRTDHRRKATGHRAGPGVLAVCPGAVATILLSGPGQ